MRTPLSGYGKRFTESVDILVRESNQAKIQVEEDRKEAAEEFMLLGMVGIIIVAGILFTLILRVESSLRERKL